MKTFENVKVHAWIFKGYLALETIWRPLRYKFVAFSVFVF